MQLSEIENLDAAALKAGRSELIEAAKAAPAAELAARYVQARTDAKQRDQKLAEQGETIKHLQSALDEAAKREAGARSETQQAETAASEAKKQIAALKDEAVGLTEELRALRAERAAVSKKAQGRRTVLADVMKLIAPQLAAED